MIKFFRKIGYNLLETSKYFKNALGEIILVVMNIIKIDLVYPGKHQLTKTYLHS